MALPIPPLVVALSVVDLGHLEVALTMLAEALVDQKRYGEEEAAEAEAILPEVHALAAKLGILVQL